MPIYFIVFAGLLSFTNYIGSRMAMSLFALVFGGARASGRRRRRNDPDSRPASS